MIQPLFVFISVLGLLAAVGTVLSRNLVHAALFLVAFFFVIACQFVLLEAEFLAAIQVLVYIGAVAILLMFGIMLTRNVQGDDTTTVPRGVLTPALVSTVGLFLVLVFGVNNHVGIPDRGGQNLQTPPLASSDDGNATEYRGRRAWPTIRRRPQAGAPVRRDAGSPTRTESIDDMGRVAGRELVNRYAVPFEVAGLLLTAALVGAVALAHRDVDEEALTGARSDRTGTAGEADGDGSGRVAHESPAAVVSTGPV